MTAPRLDIDLDKIQHNARTLVERLAMHGIAVIGVTKATLGSPEIAGALLRAGVSGLGDSRIENLEAMRRAGIRAQMTLIRSPMASQAARVVATADVSFNTELDVIAKLASAAQEAGTAHSIVLMIELGDLREGVMPGDLEAIVRAILRFPNIVLRGIGTNLACRSGVSPDARNMGELSALAGSIEATFGLELDVVSGGNSANLQWALGSADTGRINDLRLGESILLGCEPLHRRPIDGLFTDAVALVGEVIESKIKPSRPWGEIAQTAFGEPSRATDHSRIAQSILALGRQDVDPAGLCAPPGIEIRDASSDHMVIDTGDCHTPVGAEIAFQLTYGALVRAMTSPFVTKALVKSRSRPSKTPPTQPSDRRRRACFGKPFGILNPAASQDL
ncbi:MAG: alanine/ornithine racemase family PLP-dependent enzyme [Hyphomicrobiales bacterium]|nr:alanine/ornithine racemase family PLP-dependent enzyme [Hyphomicrobiales bacterium]